MGEALPFVVALPVTTAAGFLLVPGYGAQGGDAVALAGLADARGLGFIVNASRSIIYAWEEAGTGYQQAAADAVAVMRAELAGV